VPGALSAYRGRFAPARPGNCRAFADACEPIALPGHNGSFLRVGCVVDRPGWQLSPAFLNSKPGCSSDRHPFLVANTLLHMRATILLEQFGEMETTLDTKPPLLSTRAGSRLLGVNVRTFTGIMQANGVQAVPTGRTNLWRRADLERLAGLPQESA
jgi:hypothetical protein